MCVDHPGNDPAQVVTAVDYLGHFRNGHVSPFYY